MLKGYQNTFPCMLQKCYDQIRVMIALSKVWATILPKEDNDSMSHPFKFLHTDNISANDFHCRDALVFCKISNGFC